MAVSVGTLAHASPKLTPAGQDPFFLFAAAAASSEDYYLVPISLDGADDGETGGWQCLSPTERQQASRFRRPRDRCRYILTHARLRELLAQCLGIRPVQVALGWNRCGKPELQGSQAASGWHFSLSYSDGALGGMALCALSCRGRIGVDVEALRPLDDAEGLARHFFSPHEYGIYRELDPADRTLGFFHCWTRKEAVVKALGIGLSGDLSDFDVTLTPGVPARILRLGERSGERCGWQLRSIGPAGGRVAAVVTERTGS